MNLENMRELRDWVGDAENPVKLSMSDWFRHNNTPSNIPNEICNIVEKHPCGTAACLAGHAAILSWKEQGGRQRGKVDLEEVATEWLGLTSDQAGELFYGYWQGCEYEALHTLTTEQAVDELTRVINDEVHRRREERYE